MPSIRLIESTAAADGGLRSAVGIECLFAPVAGPDSDVALARSIVVALNSDRRAAEDDPLPDPHESDRRGCWADTDAASIWGGWPIGSRLWLMSRDKITDAGAAQGSTIEKARRIITEALQPFVDAKICSSFAIDLARTGRHAIGGTITIFRGPKKAIALQYQDDWAVFGG